MHITFDKIRLAGASAAIPARRETIDDLLRECDETASFKLKRTAMLAGLRERPVAPENVYTGDLGYAAARRLMDCLGWEAQTVSALYVATLTPDLLSPQVSALIAAKLGLGIDCVLTDILDDCPGLTHAAMLACGLVNSHNRRALILAGNAHSKILRREDIGNRALFGDGVGAIALEYAVDAPPVSFHYFSIPDQNFALAQYGTACRPIPGKERGFEMQGGLVTDFCRKYVHECVKKHLEAEQLEMDAVKNFYFHQPNKVILNGICKDLDLPCDNAPTIMAEYANCSGACLPLLMCRRPRSGKTMFCAFGTGLRVCSMLADWDSANGFPIVEVEKPELLTL